MNLSIAAADVLRCIWIVVVWVLLLQLFYILFFLLLISYPSFENKLGANYEMLLLLFMFVTMADETL